MFAFSADLNAQTVDSQTAYATYVVMSDHIDMTLIKKKQYKSGYMYIVSYGKYTSPFAFKTEVSIFKSSFDDIITIIPMSLKQGMLVTAIKVKSTDMFILISYIKDSNGKGAIIFAGGLGKSI